MGDYWLDGANTLRQDGYDVFHLRMSYVVARRFELYARLMNLTDRLYAAQAFEGFGDIDRLLSPGEYRSLYAGIRAKL
jgi:outer membrane receptor protein involved in Fe transport